MTLCINSLESTPANGLRLIVRVSKLIANFVGSLAFRHLTAAVKEVERPCSIEDLVHLSNGHWHIEIVDGRS